MNLVPHCDSMFRFLRIVMASVLVSALLLSANSCGKKGRIIPDGTLALICADMFIADQWILERRLTEQADTMLLYEPVFNKYGYTSLDFQATLDRQMYNPSKFARVITQSQMILQERLEAMDFQEGQKKLLRNKYDSGFRLSAVGHSIDSLETLYQIKFVSKKEIDYGKKIFR